MPAEILRVLASLRRVLWRQGSIPAERLRHDIDEHGDHHFSLTITREEALHAMHVRAKPLSARVRTSSAKTVAR